MFWAVCTYFYQTDSRRIRVWKKLDKEDLHRELEFEQDLVIHRFGQFLAESCFGHFLSWCCWDALAVAEEPWDHQMNWKQLPTRRYRQGLTGRNFQNFWNIVRNSFCVLVPKRKFWGKKIFKIHKRQKWVKYYLETSVFD